MKEAKSCQNLKLLWCLTQVNEQARSTHVWPVHMRLQLSQVVIIQRPESETAAPYTSLLKPQYCIESHRLNYTK